MHCRKGAKPVPKAVHSIMPSLNHYDLLRHVGVNNLPKVVTRQRRGRELNLQPASCKSNALATSIMVKTVGWFRMPLGMEVGLSPGDSVRYRPTSPTERGTAAPPL